MIKVNWQEFKEVLANKEATPQFIETTDVLHLVFIEGSLLVLCDILKATQLEDLADFEANYRAISNQSRTEPVQTLREVRDLRLNCVAIEGAADETGLCVATCEVPATGADGGRVIDWGEAWITGTNHDDDKITKIKVDMPDGLGGWVEVSSYTDQDSPNEGWWLPPKPTTAEVEPLGYYGQLYGGMRIRVEAQCGGSAPFTGRVLKVNLAWGIRDA